MKSAGYSLVEVLLAVVVIGIGMSAAAVMIGAIMNQEEVNQVSLRAANLQEQSVTLYRLGVTNAETVRGLLPEICVDSEQPAEGQFGLIFSNAPTNAEMEVIADQLRLTNELKLIVNKVVFKAPSRADDDPAYISNAVRILLPLEEDEE